MNGDCTECGQPLNAQEKREKMRELCRSMTEDLSRANTATADFAELTIFLLEVVAKNVNHLERFGAPKEECRTIIECVERMASRCIGGTDVQINQFQDQGGRSN